MIIDLKEIKNKTELDALLGEKAADKLTVVFKEMKYYPMNFFNQLCEKRNDDDYKSLGILEFVKVHAAKAGHTLKGLMMVEAALMVADVLGENVEYTIEGDNVTYIFTTTRDMRLLYDYTLSKAERLPYLACDSDIFINFSNKKRQKKTEIIEAALSIPFFNGDDIGSMPDFTNEMYVKILKTLKDEKMNKKALIQIEKERLVDGLAELRRDFPNFEEVIDCIEGDLALYGRGQHENVVKFEPILLGGAPGIGKTEFSRRLSALFQVPFTFTDMSAASSPRILAGADNTWKDSKPGLIFNQLYEGSVANPIIFLDEIDKAPNGRGEGYPLTALYSLLETSSNNAFKDEFFPLPINTKYINFIAAGNDITKIPEPLLTRFNYFDVPKPQGVQLHNIARSVMKNLLTKILPQGHGLEGDLSDDILRKIEQEDINPRNMLKMFKMGFKKALKDNRTTLTLEDIKEFTTENIFSYKM